MQKAVQKQGLGPALHRADPAVLLPVVERSSPASAENLCSARHASSALLGKQCSNRYAVPQLECAMIRERLLHREIFSVHSDP